MCILEQTGSNVPSCPVKPVEKKEADIPDAPQENQAPGDLTSISQGPVVPQPKGTSKTVKIPEQYAPKAQVVEERNQKSLCPEVIIKETTTVEVHAVQVPSETSQENNSREKDQSKDSWKQWPTWLANCNPYKPGSKFSDQFDVSVPKSPNEERSVCKESQDRPRDSPSEPSGPPPVPSGDQDESTREKYSPSATTDADKEVSYNHQEIVSLVSNSWQQMEKDRMEMVTSAGTVPSPADSVWPPSEGKCPFCPNYPMGQAEWLCPEIVNELLEKGITIGWEDGEHVVVINVSRDNSAAPPLGELTRGQ